MIFIFFSILTLTSGRNVPDITCDTNIPSLIFDDFSNNFVSDTPVANVASDSPESGSGFLAIQPQPNLSPISSNVAQLVSIMIFISLSACLLQFIISKINEKIPISIVCFIYGMLVYAIPSVMSGTGTDPLTEGILELRRIDNSVLYFVALPILLYEATQEINWYSFCNFLVGGISLAVVGVIFQVLLLGTFFHFALRAFPGNSINFSFLLASTISSTDPIAVLAVLGGLNAPTKLISIFNGESLINDGSSVLLFQFFYLLCIGNYASYAYYALLLVKLLFVSPLLGIAIAFFITLWISLFRRYHLAQCLAVMSGGYLVYFVAEYAISLSGPLSIVCYGIFIKVYGTIAFDREALEKHNHFVEGVCLVANSAVFMISGAVTVGMVRSLYVREGWGVYLLKLVGVYLALNVARAVMIVAFNPVLKYVRYGVDFREASLLIWGGLRGALVLVLGLRLESDPKINDSISEVIAFYISGSVILILIIQGFTFELLYRCLSPYPMNPFRRVYLRKVMKMIDVESEFRMSGLATHWLFANSRVTSCAAMLVPSLDSIRWNKVGCLQFDLPDIDEVFGRVRERAWEVGASEHEQRTNLLVSVASVSWQITS